VILCSSWSLWSHTIVAALALVAAALVPGRYAYHPEYWHAMGASKGRRAHIHAPPCKASQIPHCRWDAEADMHSCCAQEEEVAEEEQPALLVL
jgi:hypothetical protein